MFTPANEVEAQLLTSIGDDGTCDVYADWLEERGDEDRAEFLRIHKQLRSGSKDPWLCVRLAILERNVDETWRLCVVPATRVEVELPAPRPAAVQLDPPPQPKPRREVYMPPVTGMPAKIPAWIRVSSTCAYAFIVVAFVLYWLT